MEIRVDAVDVSGEPVFLQSLNAQYVPDSQPPPACAYDGLLGWRVMFDPSRRLQITPVPSSPRLAGADFIINAAEDPALWSWSDPAAIVRAAGLGMGAVTLVVGRATVAPLDGAHSDDELRTARRDASGAIVGVPVVGVIGDRDPGHISGLVIRGLQAPADPRFPIPAPELIGDPSASGAARFHRTFGLADPLRTGRFVFLEYGDADGRAYAENRRYLVVVWTPFPLDAPPLQPAKLDVVMHFSPSTLRPEFTSVRYPYGARVTAEGNVLQPYVSLGVRHLLTFHKLAFALAASGRRATIAMPLSPGGEWGPFEIAAGLWRFLLELPVMLARSGFATPHFAQHPPPATIGQVIVTGFSEGGSTAARLLTRGTVPPASRGQKFRWDTAPTHDWSSNGADRAFDDHFSEYWDVDTSFVGLPASAFQVQRQAMARWFFSRSDRRLRLYHTVGTAKSWRVDPRSEPATDFRTLLQTVRVSPPSVRQASSTTQDWAQQWDDGTSPSRWTVALFSDASGQANANDGYVGGPNGLAVPIPQAGGFFAGHELMPQVAFGHAVALSNLPSP